MRYTGPWQLPSTETGELIAMTATLVSVKPNTVRRLQQLTVDIAADGWTPPATSLEAAAWSAQIKCVMVPPALEDLVEFLRGIWDIECYYPLEFRDQARRLANQLTRLS